MAEEGVGIIFTSTCFARLPISNTKEKSGERMGQYLLYLYTLRRVGVMGVLSYFVWDLGLLAVFIGGMDSQVLGWDLH